MKSGVYLLLVDLPEGGEIRAGSLGRFRFRPGIYCYVGSGMNGLDKRVERHRSGDKKKHWHIDYFLSRGDIVASIKLRSKRKMECGLNGLVSGLSAETPVKGFGSSDCGCEAHFHLLEGTAT